MRGTLDLAELVTVVAQGAGGRGDGRPRSARPPHPIGALLPGLYQDDDFAQRFADGLDPVLGTVFLVLDSLESYLDPLVAPSDFVRWLAGWVGVDLGAVADEARRRHLVREASGLLGWQGTRRGLARVVELHTGVTPEIVETGGAVASQTPGAAAPGGPGFALVVRLRVPDPAAVDVGRLDYLISRAKPAHVVHRIEVLAGGGPEAGAGAG